MKTLVTVDGEQYELKSIIQYPDGDVFARLIPLPKTQKTLVQVGAEGRGVSEDEYRINWDLDCMVYDEIERRLQALEVKGK